MPTKITKPTKTSVILKMIGCIVVPLGGGFIISRLTANAMDAFNNFDKPPLSPPGWLFPVAWTILYVLMGVGSYFIFFTKPKTSKKQSRQISSGLKALYVSQLIFNFSWTILFFNFGAFYFAFVWIIMLWIQILMLLILSFKNYRATFWCLLPYILWVSFASYLNIAIAILN